MNKINGIYIALIITLFSCEPDDICLESNTDTPNLIINFLDFNSGESKPVVNLKIKGVDSENDFFIGTVDSISIPLSNYQNTTPFSFTKEFEINHTDNSSP